jgi:hypothetical protein
MLRAVSGLPRAIITDLMSGQFQRSCSHRCLQHPCALVGGRFERYRPRIQSRCGIAGEDVPESIRDFVDGNVGPGRQLTLRLAYHE